MTHGTTEKTIDAIGDQRLRSRVCAIGVAAITCVTAVGLGAEHQPSLALEMRLDAPGRESQRMERAKDFIADEQWSRAIEELKAAVSDPKESSRDEGLFWLAHSLNQAGDSASAVESIQRLERDYPKSRWVRPARSLRLEIAQRLGRRDVLWLTAAPPPALPAPPTTPAAVAPVPAAGQHAEAAPPTRTRRPGRQSPPSPPVLVAPATPAPPAHAPSAAPHAPPAIPRPGMIWLPEHYTPDTDLRIQALGSLIRTDAETVIPILKGIALDSENTGQARRALFVLAHSGRPEARTTVVEVAKTGPEAVRIAAVRELGRIRNVAVSNELLQVYSTGNYRVKYQVVTSLGERAETGALTRIVRSEKDRNLRETAIVTLGRAGGRDELRILYDKASSETKRPIIIGLFNARAENELIRIAERERDPVLRRDVLARLRLLGTPRAKEYLDRVQGK